MMSRQAVFVFACLVTVASLATSEDASPAATSPPSPPTPASVFRRLFTQKRAEQLAAVQQLLTLDLDRQTSLLTTMMDKMKDVLTRSRARLEASGLQAADVSSEGGFPEDEQAKSALALVMENTCFLGDVLLRFPDVVHKRFSSDREWEVIFKWCLSFVESSGLTDAATDKLLDLAAQEVGVRERDPDYVNPYRQERKRQKRFEDPPPKKKKERKKLPRGPRMSRTEL